MDNNIIYSWCFNLVEYFDLTSFVAIIVLVKKFGELLEPNILTIRSMDIGGK